MKFFILCLLVAGALAAPRQIIQRANRAPRGGIVGGTDATAGQFPYQLSFQDVSFGLQFHFCGASIYTTTWAVCAGHCVYGEVYDNPKNLDIVAGELDLSVVSGNEQRQHVIKIVLHEAFNSANLENDISLLQASSAFTFNTFVDAIPLPASLQSFAVGLECDISGWGSLEYGSGNYPDVLQHAQVPVVSDQVCRDDYLLQVFDSNICAGDEAHIDTCQGDSGGPLACSGLLAGVVSWGKECAVSGYPGIYTEVSYYIDWITTNAN